MQFSIIVPVYNVEKYLNQCIDSILVQTFKDFELILVDDGSSDKSPKICDNYAEQHEQIIVIHKQNGGASSARNAGILRAQGEYLLFMDSDDYWDDENALLKVNQTIEKEKTDIIRFSIKGWYPEEDKMIVPNVDFSKFNGLNNAEVLIKMVDCQDLKPSASGMAIRRGFITENNLLFKEGIRCEDIEWGMRLFVLLPSFGFLEESFYVYRAKREGSVTATIDFKHLCNYCDIIEDSFRLIEQCDEKVKGALSCYLTYHALIASALCHTVSISKREKSEIHRRLKVQCKAHLKKCALDKRVRLAKFIYSIAGYKVMSWVLGFYLMHRGR